MRLELGRQQFDITTRVLVMGILNRTPDSFYDGGSYFDFDGFLRKADAARAPTAPTSSTSAG